MNKVRGLFLAVAAVVVSGVTLVAPAAAQAACPDVQVVFARGTGEPVGVGRVGDAFVDALRPLVPGKSVAVDAVNYPASLDFMRAADGANEASAFVQNTVATCPDTQIVLGGYSQGAAVMDIITVAGAPTLGFVNPMPPTVADHVAAVAVFGNPSIRLLGGPLTALSPQYGYKTIDLCNGADPVCSNGNDRPAHSQYVEAGLTTQAAQFVAGRLATEAPITTLAGQTHGG
ncbi:Cutinase [Mycolicibacterium rhodesiae NBB3]|uniref:Cutinase n=1 Tax=Mycolicibacterium rhodesiae (strain NBB3) TaxID=710685 RepID=G8RR07_MYCRN|nr:cutinase family protein [Mycolicibacterium rhodesiae]AEV73932.1 Cutinase [Mycolicibacterium rhodesiae NBB3]